MSTRRPSPRKTDAERGPLGAWAYNTRTLLQASPEDAAAAAGITYPTLRKIEGGSERFPARRVVWDLWRHFQRLGGAQDIPVEDPPVEWKIAPTTATTPYDPVANDLAAAITALTNELRQWRETSQAQGDLLVEAVSSIAARLGAWPEVPADAPGAAHAVPSSSRPGQ